MGHLRTLLLVIAVASVYSNDPFQNSTLTLNEDVNFDFNVSEYSSDEDLFTKSTGLSNIDWFRRKVLWSKSSSSALTRISKSTQFEGQATLSSQVTRRTDEKVQRQSERFDGPSNERQLSLNNDDDKRTQIAGSPENVNEMNKFESEKAEPASFTSVISESLSKIIGGSKAKIEKRQSDTLAMNQMKLQMMMNKNQMMMQTISNMMAMKMMTKMKMKKMKYDMMMKKMKMKMKMAKMKEKGKTCQCKGEPEPEPELVKIDRIKLKKVPMPVESKSYKKMSKRSKKGSKMAASSKYSFPQPLVAPDPEILALPEPEVYTKKQLVSYDYTQYPNYGGDYYVDTDYTMPNMNMTTMMMMMMMMGMMTTTTTTPAPTMMTTSIVAPAAFVNFPSLDTGKKK